MTGQNKKLYLVATFLIFLLSPCISWGQEVTLYGKAPTYKNEQLEFYTYSDWITKKTKPVANTNTDEEGSFRVNFAISQTQKIFIDLGVYKAYLFIEPGNDYHLTFPEKEEKSNAQLLNPYFEGISYHIGIKNTSNNNLNYNIYNFIKSYKQTINRNLNKIYNSPDILDSLIRKLDTLVEYNHPFFKVYKKYKLDELEMIYKNSSGLIKQNLISDSTIHYHNPAYMELFNKIFKNYLAEIYSKYGGNVYKAINYSQDLEELDSAMQKDSSLGKSPEFRELVMLKGLFDGYYSNSFNKKAIIHIIDTFSTYSTNDYHKNIAKNIYEKIARLRVGYKPPDFCLYDRDSNLVCLDSLKGNYIYLGFCNSMNYSCLRDYKILTNLYKKFKDHFKIIIISTENEPEVLKHHAQQNNIPWTILHYGKDPDILKKYNVKVMPTYYFIDPEGNLSLSPAPGPSEKIEWAIFKKMRKRGDL